MSRLPTHVAVGALLRRVNDAGGFAVVRARGDAESGMVLVLLEDGRVLERGWDEQGREALVDTRRADADEPVDDFWRRRRARDPDLWVVELDARDAERVAREALIDPV